MTLFTAGFNLYSQDQASAQDAIALKMIEAMQGCIYFHKQAQQPFDSNGVSEQRSAWDKAVAQYHEYMGDLRAQNSHIEQAALADVKMSEQAADDLGMQMNESKFLFARLLDAYIAYLGQVYEKKGFFKNTYYIASNSNPAISIMPNEYNAFVQTLQSAAQQTDWGKTLNLTLPVIAESRLISDKNFNLNEIITAVRNVPLPAGYSTTAILGGVAATAALGAGAYYAYNNMDQLQDSMSDIQAYFNPASQQTEPVVASVVVEEPVVVEPTMLENAQSGFRKGVYGDEAVTVDNWQAGGDAELYGAPGLSGQEALGAVSNIATGGLSGLAVNAPLIYDGYKKLDAIQQELNTHKQQAKALGIEVNEPTFLEKARNTNKDVINAAKNFGNNALQGAFGSEVKTVDNWQAGGDAELYGAPGLSGQEVMDGANVLMMGQFAGNLAKSGVNAARNYVGSIGTNAGNAAASGAALGMAEASGLAPQAVIKNSSTPLVSKIVPSTEATSKISPNWAHNYENLPAGYIKPTPTTKTAPKSPNWENYFGQ